MDKKSKIITYIAIAVILIILIVAAIFTKLSSNVPGITAYSESGATAQAVMGGYNWNSFLKNINSDSINLLDAEYINENILLVKPSEKITLRNSGRDFDSYKFYQDEIKLYDKNGNETVITTKEVPINTESKSISFNAPVEEGTYTYSLIINYNRYGQVEYGLKVVVSNIPSYSIDSIIKYKNTYIGDAPKVNQILNSLPYKEYKDGIILRTANEPYELIVYYKDLDVEKEGLFNNTVAIFALINNVDIVTYELNEKSYVYTRKEMETILGRELSEYVNDTELWEKEVFYNVREDSNSDNLKVYKSIITDIVSKTNVNYIAIDLDSFDMIQISNAERRSLLKEFMKDGKMISEVSNAEIRQRDAFKGILIYVDEIIETENGYNITVIRYDTEKKQEKIIYEVNRDGTIIS